ncbi:hypothetical protein FIBSPDRAFT_231165 [Athelia psychrophila]|uniref:Uncharacterized protein n=1 Tax=Athelia psychrophila TaxID=1759441 RepID=A0A165YNX6_9AGAM|nr:hypothetical protein FIBSPDRAFT_231165 [Fibularhizoctonia sp. CBS 109695]
MNMVHRSLIAVVVVTVVVVMPIVALGRGVISLRWGSESLRGRIIPLGRGRIALRGRVVSLRRSRIPPWWRISVRRTSLRPVWRPTAVVVRSCVSLLLLRVLESSTAAVALLGERVRLLLGHLLCLVPVQRIEAFRLDQLVDFGGGDPGKDLL